MRCMDSNKSTIYYALYQGIEKIYDTEGNFTGERRPSYGEPTAIRVNVGHNRGDIEIKTFGIHLDYDKTIVLDNQSDPGFKEDSVFWIDAEPTDPYNYVVERIAKNLHHTTIALRRVNDGQNH